MVPLQQHMPFPSGCPRPQQGDPGRPAPAKDRSAPTQAFGPALPAAVYPQDRLHSAGPYGHAAQGPPRSKWPARPQSGGPSSATPNARHASPRYATTPRNRPLPDHPVHGPPPPTSRRRPACRHPVTAFHAAEVVKWPRRPKHLSLTHLGRQGAHQPPPLAPHHAHGTAQGLRPSEAVPTSPRLPARLPHPEPRPNLWRARASPPGPDIRSPLALAGPGPRGRGWPCPSVDEAADHRGTAHRAQQPNHTLLGPPSISRTLQRHPFSLGDATRFPSLDPPRLSLPVPRAVLRPHRHPDGDHSGQQHQPPHHHAVRWNERLAALNPDRQFRSGRPRVRPHHGTSPRWMPT